jgi:hypothetical protein
MRVALVFSALLAVILLAGVVTSPSPGGDGLVWRTSKEAGFRVKVPAGWRYRDATYPSDHSTEYWTSPSDRNSKLEVEVSACVGCVEPRSCILSGTGCRPAPEAVLPAGVVSKRKLDRWRMTYVAKNASGRYPVHGLIAIVHSGEDIRGFALAQVWLPPAQARTADAMLASFSVR